MYTGFHPDSGAEKTEAGAYSLCFVTSGHKGPIIIIVCQMAKKYCVHILFGYILIIYLLK